MTQQNKDAVVGLLLFLFVTYIVVGIAYGFATSEPVSWHDDVIPP